MKKGLRFQEDGIPSEIPTGENIVLVRFPKGGLLLVVSDGFMAQNDAKFKLIGAEE